MKVGGIQHLKLIIAILGIGSWVNGAMGHGKIQDTEPHNETHRETQNHKTRRRRNKISGPQHARKNAIAGGEERGRVNNHAASHLRNTGERNVETGTNGFKLDRLKAIETLKLPSIMAMMRLSQCVQLNDLTLARRQQPP